MSSFEADGGVVALVLELVSYPSGLADHAPPPSSGVPMVGYVFMSFMAVVVRP